MWLIVDWVVIFFFFFFCEKVGVLKLHLTRLASNFKTSKKAGHFKQRTSQRENCFLLVDSELEIVYEVIVLNLDYGRITITGKKLKEIEIIVNNSRKKERKLNAFVFQTTGRN